MSAQSHASNVSPAPGTITARIADYLGDLRVTDLSDEVRRFAKLVFLDCLGCMISGALTPSGRAALALARESPLPQARLAASSDRVAVERAAFANTICCNALDFEPVGPEGHVGTVAVPVALAVAEWRGSSGEALLASVVAGLEVGGRIGAAWRRTAGLASGDLPPVRGAPHAIFAAVAPAALLLGLDRETIRNAVGIAGYSAHVPTLRKVLETRDVPMTKYDHLGGMASAGVDAARLAWHGFTGDRDLFEGEFGAWRFSGALDCDWSLLAEFGGDWMIAPTFFKPYPCNLYDNPIAVLLEKLVREHRVRPEEITRLILRPARSMTGNLGDGRGDSMAQWLSLRLNAAHAVCGTRPFSEWQNGEPLPAPVARLVDLATIEPFTGGAGSGGKYWEGYAPTSVAVVTDRGTFEERSETLKRMTEDELVAKFLENVEPIAGAAAARELAALSLYLEDLPNVAPLSSRA